MSRSSRTVHPLVSVTVAFASAGLLIAIAVTPFACVLQSHAVPPSADVFVGVQGEPSAPMGSCSAIEQQQAIEGWVHVPVCSYVEYFTNPPSSGNHYPIWAAYETYTVNVPEGFYVHNLEHGAIVLTYNCELADGGCAADVDAAQSWMDALPVDPECVALGSTVKTRVLMTPDPHLDVPFAASAWGWTLKAQCFDPVVFGAFFTKHMDQGREDICSDGQDLSVGVGDCGAP